MSVVVSLQGGETKRHRALERGASAFTRAVGGGGALTVMQRRCLFVCWQLRNKPDKNPAICEKVCH